MRARHLRLVLLRAAAVAVARSEAAAVGERQAGGEATGGGRRWRTSGGPQRR